MGNTTMWAMIKEGRLETVKVGRRRLVIYASLKAIAQTTAQPAT